MTNIVENIAMWIVDPEDQSSAKNQIKKKEKKRKTLKSRHLCQQNCI